MGGGGHTLPFQYGRSWKGGYGGGGSKGAAKSYGKGFPGQQWLGQQWLAKGGKGMYNLEEQHDHGDIPLFAFHEYRELDMKIDMPVKSVVRKDLGICLEYNRFDAIRNENDHLGDEEDV